MTAFPMHHIPLRTQDRGTGGGETQLSQLDSAKGDLLKDHQDRGL